MTAVKPCLWFDDDLEPAMTFWTGLFPDSEVLDVQRFGPAGRGEDDKVLAASFRIAGQEVMGINGGPLYAGFTPTFSLVVSCADQAEIDHYWDALVADGGAESQCGWCTDRFGLSWQIIPANLGELLSTPSAMEAMYGMTKLVIADLH